MEEYIDKNKLIRDLIDNRSFYPAIVKNAIKNAPIEDVVPRSEIEKAKQDVAREIFELIECAFSPVLVYNGYTIKKYLAELKKKYIGE
jgi:hypothetical protein